MRKIATAKETHKLFKIKATCDGNGWDQGQRRPCYSLWEVDENDIQTRLHTDYGGTTDTYYGFTCPDCGCFTELDEKEIPPNVKIQARRYIDPAEIDN